MECCQSSSIFYFYMFTSSITYSFLCPVVVLFRFTNDGFERTFLSLSCFLMQLTLRRVMDTAKQVTKSGNLNEFSMVLLNNTLSLPLGLFLIFVFNEVEYLSRTWVLLSRRVYVSFKYIYIYILSVSVEDILLLLESEGVNR